jgi:pimeloyl-ACP methyl ester carboxylesterase
LTTLTISSIIAVHGLGPRRKNNFDHAWDTWRTPAGPQGRLWLRDDLPQSIPESRIFLYEYKSTAAYGKSRDTFIDKANELLEQIIIERDGVEPRPIVFLGHSMGGLLIKQALTMYTNWNYLPIINATAGLAFFATPHYCGERTLVSLGGLAAKIATALGFQKGDDVLERLKDGSIFSDIMQERWRHSLLQYEIVSFRGTLDDVSTIRCSVGFEIRTHRTTP